MLLSEFRVKASFASPKAFQRPDPAREAFERLQQVEQLRLGRQFDRAQAICDSLLHVHPYYQAALHTLGLVHLDKRDYQRALDSLVRAAMLDPENWATLTALSATYLRLGASEMAAQTLERARALNPADVSVLLMLGRSTSASANPSWRGTLSVRRWRSRRSWRRPPRSWRLVPCISVSFRKRRGSSRA